MKDRCFEAARLAEKNIPSNRLVELNALLWDAFLSKRETEMSRLIRAGADPDSIERRLNSELRKCRS